MDTVNICGIKFNNITKIELKDYLFFESETGKKHFIVTPNVDFIVRANNDERFKQIINKSDISLCDSAVVYKTSKILKGSNLKDVITGYDAMTILLERADLRKEKIYLLGSTEENVYKAIEAIASQYLNLKIAGYSSGFFNVDHDSHWIIDNINNSGAEYLFIGMGSPRQEYWGNKYKNYLKPKYIISVGGLFDIFSGKTKRAPIIFQKLSLEWLWRFLCEPKRLWKRYFVEDIVFFKLLLLDFFKIDKKATGRNR